MIKLKEDEGDIGGGYRTEIGGGCSLNRWMMELILEKMEPTLKNVGADIGGGLR